MSSMGFPLQRNQGEYGNDDGIRTGAESAAKILAQTGLPFGLGSGAWLSAGRLAEAYNSPFMAASGSSQAICRTRKVCALLLILGLFAQWAAGLGVSIESILDAQSLGCALQAAPPQCSVTLPAEDRVTVASIFYQPAVLRGDAIAVGEKIVIDFHFLPGDHDSVARALLRRPPRA
jgi:hypothetical protein